MKRALSPKDLAAAIGVSESSLKRWADAGKITVASDLSYAPIDFTKEGTNDPIGLDADIINCIAQAWGVKAEIKNADFGSIIQGLKGKQSDIIMSAMSVNEFLLSTR